MLQIAFLINSLLTSGDKFFDTALEDCPLQQDPALALEAFNPDVGAHPNHLPLITAAGVLLFEADHIAQPYLQGHYCYLKKSW
jgi:hypothetical protein